MKMALTTGQERRDHLESIRENLADALRTQVNFDQFTTAEVELLVSEIDNLEENAKENQRLKMEFQELLPPKEHAKNPSWCDLLASFKSKINLNL